MALSMSPAEVGVPAAVLGSSELLWTGFGTTDPHPVFRPRHSAGPPIARPRSAVWILRRRPVAPAAQLGVRVRTLFTLTPNSLPAGCSVTGLTASSCSALSYRPMTSPTCPSSAVVVVGRKMLGVDIVSVDDVVGARPAVQHLIDLADRAHGRRTR